MNLLEVGASRRVSIDTVDSQLRVPHDHRQQVVEIVCDGAGEPTYRFHLLRLAQLSLTSIESRSSRTLLGHVLEHAHESDRPTDPVVQKGDRQADRDQGTVTAKAGGLVGHDRMTRELPVPQVLEFARLVRGDIGDDAERLPDHFVC